MISSISRSILRRSLQARGPVVRRLGAMPVPQSQKAELFKGHPTNEGWESTMAWWYGTSFILIVGILGFAPPTEISAWAKKEAAARLKMKEQGVEDFAFGTHYQEMTVAEAKNVWDKFTEKALRMNDDDDEEDEDDEDEDDDEDDDE